jgi:hypothetical protein
MKVTTKPTRSGSGFVIQVDGKSAAWVDADGGSTIGRKYRQSLGSKPVPDEVAAAIERAQKKVRAGKAAK